ncbi:hypothetical protein [Leucobacter luti]|uniref:Uncharacterized protein n=1 Tax=Leucobacter luti TaxID=340320 RepID=A0A4Q7U415_9MICO|nr:hypothetical protein [Leucobacter luti]MBL3699566.1 hypothetical protein [Leucobacter luti]RZT67078.1 hypothetical protein EV139_1210 [Leucobacter luti]
MEQSASQGSILNRYGSLEEALVHRRAPVANRVFLRSLLNRVPVERLVRSDDGITVVRSDEAPDLHVHKGYTVGFLTEEEITAVVGNAPRWQSVRHPGAWAVDHPVHGKGAAIEAEELAAERGPVKATRGGARRVAKPKAEPKVKPNAQPERVQPVCPNCFMLMALSGVCGNCA